MANNNDPGHFCLKCGTPLRTRQDGHQERESCPTCRWTHYPKPSPAAAIAVIQDGQVLLVRRKFDPFKGDWTMPSGFMEYGEGPEESARREAQEELGVEVELGDLVDVAMERGDPRGLALVIFYTARIVSGEPRAADDADEVRTFPLESLPENIAFPSHRDALERIRSGV